MQIDQDQEVVILHSLDQLNILSNQASDTKKRTLTCLVLAPKSEYFGCWLV